MKSFILFLSIFSSSILNHNQAYAAKKVLENTSSDVWKGGKKIRAIQFHKALYEEIKKELTTIRQCRTKFDLFAHNFSKSLMLYGYESEEIKKVKKQNLEKAAQAMLKMVRNIKAPAMSTPLLTLAWEPQSLLQAGCDFIKALQSEEDTLVLHLRKHKILNKRHKKENNDSDSEEEIISKLSNISLEEKP